MTISVIIPAHGREELLVRCLRALDRPFQGGPDLDYEVCVVDDGSGLDEARVRENAAVEYPLVWLAFASNRGRSAARNEGIAATSGELVVFIDSDMEARGNFLRAHHDAHDENPRTAVVGNSVWPRTGGFHRYIGSRGVAKLAPGEAVPPWYFVTCNASVERADLPGKRPFDESITSWGGEDLALGIELARRGVRFGFAHGAGTYHHFKVNLAGHVAQTYRYGNNALPILTARYPELRDILRLRLLDSAVWRVIVSEPVFRTVLAGARALDFIPLPAAVYDYLTFAAYARGFLAASRDTAGAESESGAPSYVPDTHGGRAT